MKRMAIYIAVVMWLVLCAGAFAGIFAEGKEKKEFINPVSLYKTNYFATGDIKEDQVKFQLSIQYPLILPWELVYFGYTQLSYWRIYDKSSPFEETNYSPEVFFKIESKRNVFDVDLKYIDYIQLSPIQHRSNGQPFGEKDRSENKYYGEIQASIGERYNFGGRLKVFGYYNVDEGNEDINDYHKYYSAAVFIKSKSVRVEGLEKESIEVSWGGNPWEKGWVQGEFSVRIITTYFQPRLFIQGYYGYDEFMVNYNKKTKAIRVGFSF